MRIVFSAIKKNEQLDWVIEQGGRSFLFSFEDKKVINQIKYLSEKYAHLPLFLLSDSGAFSAWNSKKKINIDEYCEFIGKVKTIVPKNFEVHYFNLDVIPHIKGTKPTKEQLDTAPKKGIENWHYIKSKGHSTVNTYHHGEPIEILRRIIKECNDNNLVGVSPANDFSVEQRNQFLKETFAEIKDTVRTHCLGLTAKESMETFPVFSADSSSWLNMGKYMEGFNYKQLIKMPHLNRAPETIFWYEEKGMAKPSFKYFLHLEKYITELWNLKGVKWK